MCRRGYAVVYCFQNFFLFYAFFLKHGNFYSYQILYATSNSCKLSFHVLRKKFIDGKPFKKLVGKNTALRKFLSRYDDTSRWRRNCK